MGTSQSLRIIRRGSAASRVLGLRVRIPPGAWMAVCCECCVLSGRVLYDGPITRSEDSYRMCVCECVCMCVCVCVSVCLCPSVPSDTTKMIR
jgi:hypothetical protein